MGFFQSLVSTIGPLFLISSPITSYSHQILSIHRDRSSAGFSLEIPLIMLTASIMKIYYWLDVHYDTSLLVQAMLMVIVQVLLLHVALRNKPTPSASYSTALQAPLASSVVSEPMRRPFNFWRWRTARPYWSFLVYFTATLALLHILFRDVPSYAELLGYVALGIEATLPLPQVYENHQRKAFKGFRLSLLVNWLVGDMMKMVFFFGSGGSVPWAFKMCGMFQFACDMFLGIQYWMFGSGADARLANGFELPKGS